MDGQLPLYRVRQLESTRTGALYNDDVITGEDLVTHHPLANRAAAVREGIVVHGQPGRHHAVIGGEIQEITPLADGRVLMRKDFLLEDSRRPTGTGSRNVDVPSPMAGYIGAIAAAEGRVDIYDRQGGDLIARVRHLDPIAVQAGDTVGYGQSIGTESNRATVAVHVHMEIATSHYQQFNSYMDDLIGGRLSIDAARRTAGIDAQPVVDDGVIRVGESTERVREAQRFLDRDGFRNAQGRPLGSDGVYSVPMQAAVIRFQAAHGVPETGDLDAATLQQMPMPQRREADRPDHNGRGLAPMGAGPFGTTTDTQSVAPLAGRHPLHEQAESAVRRLDESMGRQYDNASACMAGSIACLAKQNGFERIDHVLLSIQSEQTRAGEKVFIVQGDPADPAKRRTQMQTQDAIAVPVEESLQRLTALEQAAPLRAQSEQLSQTQDQQAPRRTIA